MISKPNHNLKLSKILDLHHKFSKNKNTLPKVIGDGYLYNKNFIFKNIRDFAVRTGCKFTDNPPYPYSSFTTLALKEILETKVIAFTDNVFYIKNLEAMQPNKLKVKDLFGLGPTPNYMLHESAHSVAYSVLHKHIGSLKVYKTTQMQMLIMMLSEAFAIAAENLTLYHLDKTAVDEWFFQKNSYLSLRVPGLEWITDNIGVYNTAKLLTLMFLHSNFLNFELSKKDQSRIFEFAGIDIKIRKNENFVKNFKLIRKYSTSFNPEFRFYTTTLYTQYLGYTQSLTSMLNFDPLRYFESNPELFQALESLVSAIENGPKGSSIF